MRYEQFFNEPMKTGVSIPDEVFESAEKLALRMGVSRSKLYAMALASLVEKHREGLITAELNQIYGPGGEDTPISREVTKLQNRSIPCEQW